jgi:hypothetical protein
MMFDETEIKTGVNGEYPWGRQRIEKVDLVSAFFILMCFSGFLRAYFPLTKLGSRSDHPCPILLPPTAVVLAPEYTRWISIYFFQQVIKISTRHSVNV